ncbi:pyridoxine 5'-phosphate synthase [Brevundimonas sp. 2R-24]|uniref:Pyridoxine 5'-phosphate synthase n=1 Tax=Peiella sedimenti TaxID=3061083 RepID=A0ABT8SN25_9CAUL|nr:pyridoxine 5'-phosphate synthase [Caulobacteraceae bacterium XZ-24]
MKVALEPIRLGVNIDHVATVRNARGGAHPDPVRAAQLAVTAGADGITAHLREDRRHITDADIIGLSELCRSSGVPLNLEMAATDEMRGIALRHRPHAVCIVPERREERTTEGGLDVVSGRERLAGLVAELAGAGSRVSLFIAADPDQVRASADIGAQVVELHTGAWCEAVREGAGEAEFAALAAAADQAHDLGLEVHAGHGLDFDTAAQIARLRPIRELNIGHFLIGEAVFIGLEAAVGRMRQVIGEARAGA